jgi:hypothetical protein
MGRAIHLHVHELKNSRVIKGKDALNDKHVRRVDRRRAVQPGMLLKRIYGDLGTFSTSDIISYGLGC